MHGVVSNSCLRFASAPYCFQWALTKCFCHRCCANVLYELFVLSQSCEIRSPFPQCVKQIKMKACFYGPATVQIFGKKKGKKKSCELTVGCCEDSLWSKHILSPKWWDDKFQASLEKVYSVFPGALNQEEEFGIGSFYWDTCCCCRHLTLTSEAYLKKFLLQTLISDLRAAFTLW